MKLRVERLDDRVVPAVCTWEATAAGYQDWSDESNWQNNVVPTTGDSIVLAAGSSDIFIEGDYASLSTTNNDQLNILIKDGKTLKIAGGTIYPGGGGTKTTFTLESNAYLNFAGQVAPMGIIVANSGHLAENCHFQISGNLYLNYNTVASITSDMVPVEVLSGATLTIGTNPNNYINYSTPATFTNYGNIYLNSSPNVLDSTQHIRGASHFYNEGGFRAGGIPGGISRVASNFTNNGSVAISYGTQLLVGDELASGVSFNNHGSLYFDQDSLGQGHASQLVLRNDGSLYSDGNIYIILSEFAVEGSKGTTSYITCGNAQFDNGQVYFSDELRGVGVLDINCDNTVIISGTNFKMNYSAANNSVDHVSINNYVEYQTVPTFNVSTLTNPPAAGSFNLLVTAGISGGTAIPGTIPTTTDLLQNDVAVYLKVKGGDVRGRFWNDGLYVTSNPSYNYDVNGYDDANGQAYVGVVLFDEDFNVIATTSTDAYGYYEFLDVEQGDYIVGFVAPDPWALMYGSYTPGNPGYAFVSGSGTDSDITDAYNDGTYDYGITDPIYVDYLTDVNDIDAGIYGVTY